MFQYDPKVWFGKLISCSSVWRLDYSELDIKVNQKFIKFLLNRIILKLVILYFSSQCSSRWHNLSQQQLQQWISDISHTDHFPIHRSVIHPAVTQLQCVQVRHPRLRSILSCVRQVSVRGHRRSCRGHFSHGQHGRRGWTSNKSGGGLCD